MYPRNLHKNNNITENSGHKIDNKEIENHSEPYFVVDCNYEDTEISNLFAQTAFFYEKDNVIPTIPQVVLTTTAHTHALESKLQTLSLHNHSDFTCNNNMKTTILSNKTSSSNENENFIITSPVVTDAKLSNHSVPTFNKNKSQHSVTTSIHRFKFANSKNLQPQNSLNQLDAFDNIGLKTGHPLSGIRDEMEVVPPTKKIKK